MERINRISAPSVFLGGQGDDASYADKSTVSQNVTSILFILPNRNAAFGPPSSPWLYDRQGHAFSPVCSSVSASPSKLGNSCIKSELAKSSANYADNLSAYKGAKRHQEEMAHQYQVEANSFPVNWPSHPANSIIETFTYQSALYCAPWRCLADIIAPECETGLNRLHNDAT